MRRSPSDSLLTHFFPPFTHRSLVLIASCRKRACLLHCCKQEGVKCCFSKVTFDTWETFGSALNKAQVVIKLFWYVCFSLCLLALVEGVTASVNSIVGLFVCLLARCACTEWRSIPESRCQGLIDQARCCTYRCTYIYMYETWPQGVSLPVLLVFSISSSLIRPPSVFRCFYVRFCASFLSVAFIALSSSSTLLCVTNSCFIIRWWFNQKCILQQSGSASLLPAAVTGIELWLRWYTQYTHIHSHVV